MRYESAEEYGLAGVAAFKRAAAEMGLHIGEGERAGVRSWFEFYWSWPGRRVVGFTEIDDIAIKLIADSFVVGRLAQETGADRALSAIDLGSGNGWPGLAIKFISPGTMLTLLDSRIGACEFLEGYIRSAGLEGVFVAPLRAEEAAKTGDYRARFDLVMTRAMAQPGVSLELSVPFCSAGGKVALWLGPEHALNVSRKPAIPELGVTLLEAYDYTLPSGKGKRLLAVYRRTPGQEPAKGYPRNISSIKARPLL